MPGNQSPLQAGSTTHVFTAARGTATKNSMICWRKPSPPALEGGFGGNVDTAQTCGRVVRQLTKRVVRLAILLAIRLSDLVSGVHWEEFCLVQKLTPRKGLQARRQLLSG